MYFSFCSIAWFNHFAAVSDNHLNSEEALRKRLHAADDSERDGSDSSCSESVGGSTGGAFRPTGSPKDANNSGSLSYPAPNISVGPPIHPPPHLLPYLYPHGLYPPHHLSQFLHNPAAAAAMNHPGLNFNLFNAQLALAAQHPALFGHYSGHSPVSPLHALKGGGLVGAGANHRFAPYNLPSGFGSAFDAVMPSNLAGQRSLSTSPRPQQHHSHPHRASSNSPPIGSQRPISVSPPVSTNKTTVVTPKPQKHQSSPSELKSIEKMVNGLDSQKNGSIVDDAGQTKINLTDQ